MDPVDTDLVERAQAEQLFRDGAVDVFHGLRHALTAIAAFVAVTQLHGLVCTRGRPRRNKRAAKRAVFEPDINFYRRVAPAIQHLPSDDLSDDGHECLLEQGYVRYSVGTGLPRPR